jgi:hypothetical protein
MSRPSCFDLLRRALGVALLFLLMLADGVSYVHATTNAVTPEVAEDSWLIATKWPLPPAPGQIVLVQEGPQTRLYRVVRIDNAKGEVVLSRNGEAERTVKLGSVQGTVVFSLQGPAQP